MEKTGSVVFCGVGGQGIILASDITSFALIKAGFDVKKSEVHGMAQRGGSVVAHLRYGKRVHSPFIEPGTADIEVAFEMLESLRYIRYLHKESNVVLNTQKILPSSVATGVDTYPEDTVDQLRSRGLSIFPIDAFDIAKSVGETRAVNMVLVGALSVFLPVGADVFLDVINEKVPERFRTVNREAFVKGTKIIRRMQEVEKKR